MKATESKTELPRYGRLLRLCLVLGALLSALLVAAEEPELTVTTYRGGKKAALSFTFDDGTRDHAEIALPLLRKYGIRATFLAIAGKSGDPGYLGFEQWRQLAGEGHEIANHSLTHTRKLGELNDADELRHEIDEPLRLMESECGVKMRLFCPPFGSRSPESDRAARVNHRFIIGGRFFVGGKAFKVRRLETELDKAVRNRRHLVLMLHGLSTEYGGWEPLKNAAAFEDCLKAAKAREGDLWIAPWSEVASYREAAGKTHFNVEKQGNVLRVRFAATPEERTPLTFRLARGSENGVTVSQSGMTCQVTAIPEAWLFEADPQENDLVITLLRSRPRAP